MSDNIAYALLVYTALQIFMTMGALHGQGRLDPALPRAGRAGRRDHPGLPPL
jgi:hypothetical protein